MTGSPQVLWHVSNHGECGSMTHMAAYNRFPTACNQQTGTANSGILISPAIVLTHAGPLTLEYDELIDKEAPDVAAVRIHDAGGTGWATLHLVTSDAPTIRHVTVSIPSVWEGKEVNLGFFVQNDQAGNSGPGWAVDNVVVKDQNPRDRFGDLHWDGSPDPTNVPFPVPPAPGPGLHSATANPSPIPGMPRNLAVLITADVDDGAPPTSTRHKSS